MIYDDMYTSRATPSMGFEVIKKEEIDAEPEASELLYEIRAQAAKALFDDEGWYLRPTHYVKEDDFEFRHSPTRFELDKRDGRACLMHSGIEVTFPGEGAVKGLVHPLLHQRIEILWTFLKNQAIAREREADKAERILTLRGVSEAIKQAREEFAAPPEPAPMKLSFWQKLRSFRLK